MSIEEDLVYPLAPVNKYFFSYIDQSNLNAVMKKLVTK